MFFRQNAMVKTLIIMIIAKNGAIFQLAVWRMLEKEQ